MELLILSAIAFLLLVTVTNFLDSLNYLTYFFSVGFVFLFSRLIGFSWTISLILCFGFSLRLIYTNHTHFTEYSYDWWGHLKYVEFISNSDSLLSIPPISECWVCYHPPLYYWLTVLFSRLIEIFSELNINKIHQLFSLICSLSFLLISTKIFKKLISSKLLQIISISLIAFWPSGIIDSARIGNDVLLNLFFAISFYYLLSWYKLPKNYFPLVLSGIFACLSFWTKTNGLLVIALILVTICTRLLPNRSLVKKHPLKLFVTILSLFILWSSSAAPLLYRQIEEIGKYKLVANHLGNDLKVQNKASTFLWFDLKNFIQEPFTNSRDNSLGRQNFWNYLLKTSLFEEFTFKDVTKTWAVILSFCLIFGIFTCLLSFVLNKQPIEQKDLPLYALFIILLLASLYARLASGYSSANDFRYIYPILITGIYFYTQSISFFLKHNFVRIHFINIFMVIVFCSASTLFFLSEIFGYKFKIMNFIV